MQIIPRVAVIFVALCVPLTLTGCGISSGYPNVAGIKGVEGSALTNNEQKQAIKDLTLELKSRRQTVESKTSN